MAPEDDIDDELREMQLLHAEIFGRDGKGGRFAALETTVHTHT